MRMYFWIVPILIFIFLVIILVGTQNWVAMSTAILTAAIFYCFYLYMNLNKKSGYKFKLLKVLILIAEFIIPPLLIYFYEYNYSEGWGKHLGSSFAFILYTVPFIALTVIMTVAVFIILFMKNKSKKSKDDTNAGQN